MDAVRELYRNLTLQAHAATISDFPSGSTPYAMDRKGVRYWGVRLPDGTSRYIGKDGAGMEEILRICREGKVDACKSRLMVDGLIANGFPAPNPQAGAIIADFARAGFFRLRAVLVGTMAFQCYLPMLDLRLGGAFAKTGDIDLAQFCTVSMAVANIEKVSESMGAILARHGKFMQPVDFGNRYVPTWKKVGSDLSIDLLTAYHGNEEIQQLRLPALGAWAAKLKFLDFLIYDEMPAAILHGGGVPVNVPRPERYCIHKILVAYERRDGAKRRKDIQQASCLLGHFMDNGIDSVTAALREALGRGKGWRKRIGHMFRSERGLNAHLDWYESVEGAMSREDPMHEEQSDESCPGMPL